MVSRYGLMLMCWLLLGGVTTQGSDEGPAPPQPEVRPDGWVVFRASGRFMGTPQQAKESALQEAQQRIRWWLSEQDPPIRKYPSLEQIRRELILQESSPIQESLGEEKRYQAGVTVALRPETVRSLRGTDRVLQGVWILGGVLALLCVMLVALRLNEWSKGYLATWLILAAAGITTGLTVLWWWAK